MKKYSPTPLAPLPMPLGHVSEQLKKDFSNEKKAAAPTQHGPSPLKCAAIAVVPGTGAALIGEHLGIKAGNFDRMRSAKYTYH